MTAAATLLPPDADPALRVDRAMTHDEMWERHASHVIYDDDLQYPVARVMDDTAYVLTGRPRQRHMHLVV